MRIFSAPMQGLTEAPWRAIHARLCSPADAYFTPFLRVEKGEVRPKDIRDLTSPLNAGINLIPQVIFKSADELKIIAERVIDAGFNCLDLNLGCPFPPQVRHGRGAALTRKPDVLAEVAAMNLPLNLSVKMRPGVDSTDDWHAILPIINDMPLSFVTIHPRPASQGYKGPVNRDCFAEMAAEIRHPLVFNGDIHTPADIDTYNNIYGVMIGRGLIARPSLIEEWRSDTIWSPERRLALIGQILDELLTHYSSSMCGDTQALLHLRPFLEYLDPELPPKALKPLRKASSLRAFEKALLLLPFRKK